VLTKQAANTPAHRAGLSTASPRGPQCRREYQCVCPTCRPRSTVREVKVESIRRRIANGTYDLDGALDAVIERILAVIDP